MSKYTENDKDLLLTLLSLQEKSAPIKLSIGWIRDGFVTPGIVLHTAPPYVIDELIKRGYVCDMKEGGMAVYKM